VSFYLGSGKTGISFSVRLNTPSKARKYDTKLMAEVMSVFNLFKNEVKLNTI
jgi:hypothetical protein